MRGEDAVDVGRVVDPREAVVVDDEVVTLGPFGGLEERNAGIALPPPLRAGRPFHGPDDPFADPLHEDFDPRPVVMRATAGDEEDLEGRRRWSGRGLGGGRGRHGKDGRDSTGQHLENRWHRTDPRGNR